MKLSIGFIFLSLLFSSCAGVFVQRDYALERYQQYHENLNKAVERGELTPIQAETLDIQALNQYMIIRQQKQQLQAIEDAQVLGALSNMTSQPAESEGKIINQAQKVYCTNCQ